MIVRAVRAIHITTIFLSFRLLYNYVHALVSLVSFSGGFCLKLYNFTSCRICILYVQRHTMCDFCMVRCYSLLDVYLRHYTYANVSLFLVFVYFIFSFISSVCPINRLSYEETGDSLHRCLSLTLHTCINVYLLFSLYPQYSQRPTYNYTPVHCTICMCFCIVNVQIATYSQVPATVVEYSTDLKPICIYKYFISFLFVFLISADRLNSNGLLMGKDRLFTYSSGRMLF